MPCKCRIEYKREISENQTKKIIFKTGLEKV